MARVVGAKALDSAALRAAAAAEGSGAEDAACWAWAKQADRCAAMATRPFRHCGVTEGGRRGQTTSMRGRRQSRGPTLLATYTSAAYYSPLVHTDTWVLELHKAYRHTVLRGQPAHSAYPVFRTCCSSSACLVCSGLSLSPGRSNPAPSSAPRTAAWCATRNRTQHSHSAAAAASRGPSRAAAAASAAARAAPSRSSCSSCS